MAELLVRAFDGTGDPSYFAGDVVTIREDGHQWATQESKQGGFLIVKVPGVKASELYGMCQEGELRKSPPVALSVLSPAIFRAAVANSPKTLVARRAWTLSLESLSFDQSGVCVTDRVGLTAATSRRLIQ